MENYVVTVIANGDEDEARTAAQACVDTLKKAGHQVMTANVAVERGGAHALVTAADEQAAREQVAVAVMAEEALKG